MVGARQLSSRNRPLAERVFDVLQARILELDLVPGARLSEAEVAGEFDISRQPVRDAFHRLSKLGFLDIRPQRATTVSLIRPQAILEARFFRTACEVEMVRRAAEAMADKDEATLDSLIKKQAGAVADSDSDAFKTLDDAFHRTLCRICGLEPVWFRIAENKAHTDRLRLLSIRDSSGQALEDHKSILAALKARDGTGAAEQMRRHLDRIRAVLRDLRTERADWFLEEDA